MAWRFALNQDECLSLLLEWNQTCSPPWSEKELRHKIREAKKEPFDYPYGDLRDGVSRISSAGYNATTTLATGGEDSETVPILPGEEIPWPDPISPDAWLGPLADWVQLVQPFTEADPHAVLIQSLALFGNAIGRGPHFSVGHTPHHGNLFVCIVGGTSTGKKGTSWSEARSAFSMFEDWHMNCQASGLASGEGLINAVRDANQQEFGDPGVTDKRLMVHEPEFARTLKQNERRENILGAVLRQAWETGDLRTLVKHNPTRATGAHISVVGHITKEELLACFRSTDAANGLGNRFLWCASRRSKVLPNPRPAPHEQANQIRSRILEAITFASELGELARDADAEAYWCDQLYTELDSDIGGMIGQLTARAHPQVLRLALIYALSTSSQAIGIEHLKAAHAVWRYTLGSVRWIFGEQSVDPTTEELLRIITASPDGISRTDLHSHLGRHMGAADLTRRLNELARAGLIRGEQVKTTGRPKEVWSPILMRP